MTVGHRLKKSFNWKWFGGLSQCLHANTTCSQHTRHLYSKTGHWEEELTLKKRFELEAHWKDRILKKTGQPKCSNGKYYVLSMFPYPSGNLHMGHVRVYTISDTMARYHKMKGRNVIHPMGWDAFGLPAENAAIDRGELPENWTKSNIKTMKKQMDDMCFDFDWSREVSTCDPSYYKWTQYIFLKMFEKGLVYQKQAVVNWDPVDKTVLANEQIDEQGHSWRSGAKVEKQFLRQWWIRITAFSKALLDGLNDVDPVMWKEINKLQRAWIGKCEGCHFIFQLFNHVQGQELEDSISVYTATPEGLYGVSHITVPEDHWLCLNHTLESLTDGVSRVKDMSAVHPVTKKKIPMFVDHTVEPLQTEYETRQEHLGIPSFSDEDRKFANKCGLNYCEVCTSDSSGQVVLTNSGQFDGLHQKEAFHAITEYARKNKFGGHLTSARLTDWLISRQRYWGTPIPVIHCPECKTVPVPYSDLPVELPKVDKVSGRGASALRNNQEWIKVTCPECGGPAERESDTMDTFVDSSWYFLRYTDPDNKELPFSKEKADRFMPVDLYIGGIEHALLHLYYARFFQHFLHSEGLVSHREPFIHILTQGMVKGESYQLQSTGKYIPVSQVDFSGKDPVEKGTGAKLIKRWEKMSKSKFNGVDPLDVLAAYGIDCTRLAMLSSTAPKADRNWSHQAHGVMTGVLKWQNRIWRLVSQYRQLDTKPVPSDDSKVEKYRQDIFEARNSCLQKVNYNMNKTFLMNAVNARLHGFTSDLVKIPEVYKSLPEYGQALCDLVIMLAPFAPLLSSELWCGLKDVQHRPGGYNWNENVLHQYWPSLDGRYPLPVIVKVNHNEVFRLGVPWEQFRTLTADVALKKVTDSAEFKRQYDVSDISRTTFKMREGLSGIVGLIMNSESISTDSEELEETDTRYS